MSRMPIAVDCDGLPPAGMKPLLSTAAGY